MYSDFKKRDNYLQITVSLLSPRGLEMINFMGNVYGRCLYVPSHQNSFQPD